MAFLTVCTYGTFGRSQRHSAASDWRSRSVSVLSAFVSALDKINPPLPVIERSLVSIAINLPSSDQIGAHHRTQQAKSDRLMSPVSHWVGLRSICHQALNPWPHGTSRTCLALQTSLARDRPHPAVTTSVQPSSESHVTTKHSAAQNYDLLLATTASSVHLRMHQLARKDCTMPALRQSKMYGVLTGNKSSELPASNGDAFRRSSYTTRSTRLARYTFARHFYASAGRDRLLTATDPASTKG